MIDAIAFATPEDWAAWLADHHASSTEVWLRIYKKSSGIPSIDWGQAVIEALAWGWIDGVKKSVSETEWAQRFTPRKPGSAWSRTNRAHAEKLIAEGRMRPAGLAHVAVAQANGRWESAYAGSRTAEMPEDFLLALAEGPQAARDEYEGLNGRNRYAIYYRLTTAKRPEIRAKRIAEYVAMLARGETLH
ncbi:YdeI/OmpD-associated family protein [Cypionkella sinensis]|uniref:YdeI family protein n=1 Tax=Cypionkella sinensis TaxID=1756043 RepID=A0ABV7J2J8_9RHOB